MNAATLYRRGHRLTRTAGALGLCLLLSAAFLGCSQPAPPPIPPTPENSAELSSTAIVPTLDTPLPENKSALWCCTFQMAWDELKTDVVKEPIRLGGAEEVAERLNKNEFSPGNLTEGSYYKTAGYNRDGVHDRIRQEMNRRFPGEPVIGLGDNPPNGFTAFAFLKVGLAFDRSYPDNPDAFRFKSSDGTETAVRSMGYLKETQETERLPRRVSVLYCAPWGKGRTPESFVLDLDNNSKPNQLLLAAVERQATLQKTLAAVEEKVADNRRLKRETVFYPNDRLLVPCMKGHLDHHFNELEDKYFLNPEMNGLFIGTAFQSIAFQLDGTGVQLKSTAVIKDKDKDEGKDKPDVREPKDFYFNRPFLLIMKKRDAKEPFFVMWVDNAELLEKR